MGFAGLLRRGRRLVSYKTCALLAIAMLGLQLYLALSFLSLEVPDASPSRTPVGPEEPEEGDVSARAAADDEDSPAEVEAGSMKRAAETPQKPRVDSPRLRLDELDFVPPCDILAKEAVSAVHRAKTQNCKRKIAHVACAIQQGKFYHDKIPNFCPNDEKATRRALGCFRDEKNFRLLSGYYADYKESNSPEHCANMCLQGGFPYAGVQYSTECFCGETPPPSASKLADTSCNAKCPGDPRHLCGGYFTMNVFQTGIVKFNPQIAAVVTDHTTIPVRIVFLLTLNGRALRQVKRLINVLYDEKHFFFIHVDARQDYLYRELSHLETDHPNIKMARKRFATIWGGASLLEMLLASMKDLLSFDWKWDFVINLSESDFPVKSVEKLEEFLSANRGKNFVKSHGREVQRFIQKQGLDKTFVECDAHMWRVGDRRLPWGLQIDGGSDWIALDREFVSYVASEPTDPLLSGLLKVFKHTLLPAESFFHTVLRNSKFCNTYVDNNLHVTNWKRKLGCKCQYKHVVDWCGCSPNDFRSEDWPRLQATDQRQLFFARKFEPVINQAIILRVEQWVRGTDQEQIINVDAYWQSIYHSADASPPPDDSLVTIATGISRLNSKLLLEESCHIKPGKVKEVSSYHFADVFKGALVLHEAHMNDFGTVLVETWFKYLHYLQVNRSSKLFERLKVLSVSSEFDQKEQVFRNLVRVLGPFSEPSLMYHFIPGAEEPLSTSNLTIVWIDPAGNIADVNEAFIDEGNVVNFIKPNLKVPLLPGVWTVKVFEIKTLIAVTKFLIVPLQFISGAEVSQQETEMLHSGPSIKYKNFTSHVNKFKQYLLSDKDRLAAKSKSEANAKRFGLDLKEWIDSLILQFYSVLGTCMSSKETKPVQCGKITLLPCHLTTWSSHTSDPKSFEGKLKKHSTRKNYFDQEKSI